MFLEQGVVSSNILESTSDLKPEKEWLPRCCMYVCMFIQSHIHIQWSLRFKTVEPAKYGLKLKVVLK